MSTDPGEETPAPQPDKSLGGDRSFEERRIVLDEQRLALDNSFARKWWPTVATLVAAAIGGLFAWVQTYQAAQETQRARYDAETRELHEWQTRIANLYFDRRELFDVTKNPDAADSNLRILIAVAPPDVQGILIKEESTELKAEIQRIPPPTGEDDPHRLSILAAAASVQQTLASATSSAAVPGEALRPTDFAVYIQYLISSEPDKQMANTARLKLLALGYHVPNLQAVKAVPRSLEVRYYHSNQKLLAAGLAQQLQTALDSQIPAKAVPFESPRPLPSGILEVWIPDLPRADEN